MEWFEGFIADRIGESPELLWAFAVHAAVLPLGPLTAVIVGPQYHRVHHGTARASQGCNFAQAFPIFDWLGGTYRRPRAKEYGATGVEECRATRDRWRPLLW